MGRRDWDTRKFVIKVPRTLRNALRSSPVDDMTSELDLCGRRGHEERSSCISQSTSGG
jgi:hypothetical protein